MSFTNKKYKFPAKHPMKNMKELMDAGEIKGVQVTKENGSVLVDLPVTSDFGKLVPKIFKLPIQVLGVGISTIARMLSVSVIFTQKKEPLKHIDEK